MTLFYRNIFFFLFFTSTNIFSQSLIGVGAGAGTMSFTNDGKPITNPYLTSDYKYIPMACISICGIHSKHFSPELNIDFSKQELFYNLKGSGIPSAGGGAWDEAEMHFKYEIILSHISFLCQYRAEIRGIKFYFGAGPFYAFNISKYSGWKTEYGANGYVNNNGVWSNPTFYDSSNVTNAKYKSSFANFVLTSSIEIPLSQKFFLSPNIIYRRGLFSIKQTDIDGYDPYHFYEIYFSISLKYYLEEMSFFKRIREKIQKQTPKE